MVCGMGWRSDGRDKKKKRMRFLRILFLGDPLGARTQDPNIKSVVLYQLS